MTGARAFLEKLFETAIAAAHPATCLVSHLPEPSSSGRLILLAAGKAAGSMIEVAEAHYLDRCGLPANRLTGIAVARHGYGRPTRVVPMIEAGHPIPDAAGLESAAKALALADGATADDLVLVLMSGGASANWIAPAAGLTLADKQAVTRALLRSGADDRRDQHRAQASLAHQGRPPRARRASGAGRRLRDLRRARRRPGGDRLRADRAGSDHARGRARHRGEIQTSTCRKR